MADNSWPTSRQRELSVSEPELAFGTMLWALQFDKEMFWPALRGSPVAIARGATVREHGPLSCKTALRIATPDDEPSFPGNRRPPPESLVSLSQHAQGRDGPHQPLAKQFFLY